MSDGPPERTEQQREAARLERERRRSQPGGGEDSQLLGADAGAADGDGAAHYALDGDRLDDDDALEDDGWLEDDDHEVPAGTRRVSRLQRQQAQPARAPRAARSRQGHRPARRRKPVPVARRSRAERPGAPKRRTRRRVWTVRGVSLLALLLTAGAIWFLIELLQPFHGSGHGRVTVRIPPHSTAGEIGDLLQRDGVIASSFFFGARAALDGDRSKLRSGTYNLKLDMSYSSVLTTLTTAPKAAKTSNLTIDEGDNRFRIASLLRAQHVRGNYLAATRHSRLINPVAYGAPRSLPSLEGFLFPSTYQLLDPPSAQALADDQLKTFKQRFATVNLSYARSKHLSPFDVLTIASMVQGEAQTLHDMPLVASVIYNRLRDGMLLGIDATTRYATHNFTTPLTQSQLSSRSPYNTRVRPGLPLGPIDNPGLAAIRAAAHPAHTNYLYFVAKPCGNGASVFTSSYSQFLRDSQRYQAARAARGGRSPLHC